MPNCWSYPKILGADLSTLMGIINKASPNWKPGPEGGPRTWTSQSMGETEDLRPPHSDPVLGQSLSVPLATAVQGFSQSPPHQGPHSPCSAVQSLPSKQPHCQGPGFCPHPQTSTKRQQPSVFPKSLSSWPGQSSPISPESELGGSGTGLVS